MGGSDRAAFTATLCWEERNVRVAVARDGRIKEKGKSPLTGGVSGSITNDQRPSLIFLTALRLTARLALVAAYSGGRRSWIDRERASATGLAVSSISKMRSSLSMMGMIRRWWRLARTEAALSLASARLFSTSTADSSRPGAKRETGHATWSRPSLSEPYRCRGRPGSSLQR
jgi:hypothetical protein